MSPNPIDESSKASGADERALAEPQAPQHARWRALGGVLVAGAIVAFVASVVLSTPSASVPVGASGSMSGMTMGPNRLAITMRDVSNLEVRLPGGRPGVVIFAAARRCDLCVSAVRAAGDAVRQHGDRAQLIVVMNDSATSRADIRAFDRSMGQAPARYVIDDRNNGVASMLGPSSLGGVLVYDAQGRVVAHPQATPRQIVAALKRTGR